MWYLTLIGGLGVIMLIAFCIFFLALMVSETFEGATVLAFLSFWVLVGILLIGIGFLGW